MADDVILIDAESRRTFQFPGGQPFAADFVLVHNRRVNLDKLHRDGHGTEILRYQEMAQELSGQEVSAAAAIRFVNVAAELCDGLKKNTDASPSSAGATASTSST